MAIKSKVGILTFHCVDNLGAVLQCYALQETVRKMGMQVEVINYCPKNVLEPYKLFQNPFDKGYAGRKSQRIKVLIANFVFCLFRINTKLKYERFRSKYLKCTKTIYRNREQLKSIKNEYSHLIAGSDQIWNPNILRGFDPAYFLSFSGNNTRKIAYAASFGESPDKIHHKDFQDNLQRFDYISIREESTQILVNQFIDKAVCVTLDPTLLLATEEWTAISSFPTHDNYIVVYDLWQDKRIIDIVNAVADTLNMNVISFSRASKFKKGISSFFYDGPSEFIGLLLNAKFVITSSFHGTTLSIASRKSFITIPHPVRGARMIDLLNKLELSDRLINSVEDLKKFDLGLPLDYSAAEPILESEKNKSFDFLKVSLS